MAVTTPYYKNGPIKYMTGSSGDIDTGGQFLNDNFTQIYDLINPSTDSVGVLKQVPAVCEGSSSTTKVTTFALPSTSGLTSGTPYVAVYDTSGSVTWQPYSSVSAGAGGSTSGAVSELVYPGGSARNDYLSGSVWLTRTSSLGAYQKTYKTATNGSSIAVDLPDFGSWLVTGTILFASDYMDSDDRNYANLVRVYIYGHMSYKFTEIYDVCNNTSSQPTWTTSSNLLSASALNGVLTISTTHSNVSSVFADLSVIGGCRAHESSGLTLVTGSNS